MSETLLEVAPPARSLPVVLRDALARTQLELLVGKVAAVPDRAHVTVDIGGSQFTVPKLSHYGANVGEPCYLLADRDNVLATGTVTGAAPPTLPDLTVTGTVTAGAFTTATGGVTCAGLQVNGGAAITTTLNVGGTVTAGAFTTTTGGVTAAGLQINGSANVTGGLTAAGLQINGSANVTGGLTVGGAVIAARLAVSGGIDARPGLLGFFGATPTGKFTCVNRQTTIDSINCEVADNLARILREMGLINY